MAKQKIYEGKIPFSTKDDSQLHFPDEWALRQGHVVMKDNFVFQDTLTFIGFSRGRSAAYAEFQRSSGSTVVVFLTDLDAMMLHLHAGHITGFFTFCKRGMNYGCRFVGLTNPQQSES